MAMTEQIVIEPARWEPTRPAAASSAPQDADGQAYLGLFVGLLLAAPFWALVGKLLGTVA